VLRGQHTVIAAETGSGKTFAYLAPLISRLLAATPAAGPSRTPLAAVVLCPNAMLAAQVANAANSLCDAAGAPLLRAVALSPSLSLRAAADQGAPLVVATPARLLEELFAFRSGRWKHGAYPAAVHAVRCLVVDEADMLLTGGFEAATKRCVQLFDAAEAARAAGRLAAGPPPDIEEPAASWDMREVFGEEGDAPAAGEEEGDAPAAPLPVDVPLSQAAPEPLPPRQYIFAAATLHSSGRRTPGETLRSGFPEAAWVAGPRLHRAASQLTHAWAMVTSEERPAAVADVLRAHSGGQTLVFANTVAEAAALAEWLVEHAPELACGAYHGGMPTVARTEALDAFRAGVLQVMVCTDAGARGLDVPGVRHVVQASFALSAMDYLHRAGRTARAGAPGRLTSFYDEAAAPLVEAVRTAVDAGQPVDAAFSRKRSFAKKRAKYGDSRLGPVDETKAAASAAAALRRQLRHRTK
jgi:superfamily II DNA/RNA helicase